MTVWRRNEHLRGMASLPVRRSPAFQLADGSRAAEIKHAIPIQPVHMREVVLVRHGMPTCDHGTRIRGRDFARWVEAFERAPLDRSLPPPAELRAQVATVSCVVTSTKRRAIESAALVAPDRPLLSDPLFDEAGIPTAIELRLALAPVHWDAIARLAWMLGWSRGVESASEARSRADRAARQLAGLASTHGSVALVGHGMLNTLIARALRRDGWIGAGSARAYWGRVTLRRAP